MTTSFVMMSLLAANCSTFLLPEREIFSHQ